MIKTSTRLLAMRTMWELFFGEQYMKNIQALVRELIKNTSESECVEFKNNNTDPNMIGEYISALSNSATYYDKQYAYMLWGIDDKTKEFTNTSFDYRTKKGEGNEDLEPWLRRLLSDNADFEFKETMIDGNKVVVLIISQAIGKIVSFKAQEYIRVGSYKKKMKDYPKMESQLWAKINGLKFEEMNALEDVAKEEVISLLDYVKYYDLSGTKYVSSADGIIHYLLEEKIVRKQDNGLFSITNLGALLFAKRMSDFPSLERKSVRIIQYEDDTHLNILKQNVMKKGYASGFEELVEYISGLLPSKEEIESPLRKEKTVYPLVAIRELMANALIHQDLTPTGTGPIIEIFKNRVEITNPGAPLVSVIRIVDNPPRSRNEMMANLMRRLGICEELGTGWDRVVACCEEYLLPAPQIDIYDENMRVTISAPVPYKKMTHEERLWTCYLHVCLKYVNREKATNSTLRARLGLASTASASVSRLISLAIEHDYIKPLDKNTAPKYMSYVPFWA